MRPSAVTAAASVKTSPAPPTARDTRCARCHSVGSAVLGAAVLAHGRDADAVAEADPAQLEGGKEIGHERGLPGGVGGASGLSPQGGRRPSRFSNTANQTGPPGPCGRR